MKLENGLFVTCTLKRMKHGQAEGTRQSTLVFAKVMVKNPSKNPQVFDLNDIGLVSKEQGVASEQICVDIPASVLIEPEVIKAGNERERRVYWIFDSHLERNVAMSLEIEVGQQH